MNYDFRTIGALITSLAAVGVASYTPQRMKIVDPTRIYNVFPTTCFNDDSTRKTGAAREKPQFFNILLRSCFDNDDDDHEGDGSGDDYQATRHHPSQTPAVRKLDR